jgi:hypothetical protein
MIENVPVTVSGILPTLISNEVYNAERFTGDSIGTSVANKYQPAIISLTASTVLKSMELEGADVSSIHLGDFSINKGQGSNVSSAADKYREDGLYKLGLLGEQFTYYKALG